MKKEYTEKERRLLFFHPFLFALLGALVSGSSAILTFSILSIIFDDMALGKGIILIIISIIGFIMMIPTLRLIDKGNKLKEKPNK